MLTMMMMIMMMMTKMMIHDVLFASHFVQTMQGIVTQFQYSDKQWTVYC